jgi:hypothetical protein
MAKQLCSECGGQNNAVNPIGLNGVCNRCLAQMEPRAAKASSTKRISRNTNRPAPTLILQINVELMATSWGINVDSAKQYLEDGQKRGWVAEVQIASRLGFVSAPGTQLPYDVLEGEKKWEVRTINKRVAFSPSKSVGAGRMNTVEDFYIKVNELNESHGGYLLVDGPTYENDIASMAVYRVPAEWVLRWKIEDRLAKDSTTSAMKLYELINGEQNAMKLQELISSK